QLLQFHKAPSKQRDKHLALAAMTLSFGITHHPSLLFIGIIALIYLLIQDRQLFMQPQRWKRPFLFTLLGALPMLYLPLRANSGAPGATPGLATWSGFWFHALAKGFSNDLFSFIQPDELWQRFKVMGNVMTFQFSPWLLAGMIIGFIWLLRKDKRLAFLLGGAFLFHTFITATYRAPQTVEYMIPAYIPAVLLLGVCIGNFAEWGKQAGHLIWLSMTILVTAVFLLTAIHQGVQNFPSYQHLHHSTDTREYTQTIFDNAPADAIVLADWHWFSPLRYLQIVEGQRSDLEIHLVNPGAGTYGITWANRIELELQNGRSVIATHYDAKAYEDLPVNEPIGTAFLYSRTPRTTLPATFTPTEHQLPGFGTLMGFELLTPAVEIGAEAILNIAWKADTAGEIPLYAHLIGFDGRLYAQDDLTVTPQPTGITITQLRLTPRPGALPGDFAIFIGSGESRIQLTTLTVTAMHHPPVTQQAVNWEIVGERPSNRIIGYDWDHTLPDQPRLYLHLQTPDGYYTEVYDNDEIASLNNLSISRAWRIRSTVRDSLRTAPNQHYVPMGQGIVWIGGTLDAGEALEAGTAVTVTIQPTFRSSQPIQRDLAISIRLIGYEADNFHWDWWDLNDSIPAMGAIPTLKWIAGSQVRSPHFLEISADATAGQTIGATLLLYDAFTNTPLPILDGRIVAQNAWIPLGNTTINN
ncbi:MAG: hypothetical protein GY943_09655, partial [Chloroflexi bacterium]|nr:hypothetical protein [Chloroflexota bacterium]